MKTINIAYPEKSDVTFKVSKFPDGQQQIKIDNESLKSKAEQLSWTETIVQIKSRLNNFLDLELIIETVVSLRGLGVKEIHLYTPYFLGSRSDIKFEEGSNNYLKEIICPIINNLKLESITILDPHSTVLEGCLNNFRKIDNRQVVERFITDTNATLDSFILISPDGGALKKIYKTAEQIGYKGEVITCSKSRGVDGKISKTVVPDLIDSIRDNKNFILVDDLIDGGKTFIEIAKIIKEQIAEYNKSHEPANTSKLYLIVTHGIFSKGFGELAQYFEAIYTTNSYKDFMPDTRIFIKQLNVF